MIRLVSINIGEIEPIGTRRGKPVLSGIRKRPVGEGAITLSRDGISGDHQADLRVHGGPNKAVYAYSSDHYPWWAEQMGTTEPYGPGAFGENLTLAEIDETGVHLGDVWQWGTAVLQICQPRYPCFKLALATDRPKVIKDFLESGRSGWYLRLLEPGEAALHAPITVQEADPAGITIREVALAAGLGIEPERQIEIAGHPALAPGWANMLRQYAIARP
jgi:MOSC domain-containing protein YiiM